MQTVVTVLLTLMTYLLSSRRSKFLYEPENEGCRERRTKSTERNTCVQVFRSVWKKGLILAMCLEVGTGKMACVRACSLSTKEEGLAAWWLVNIKQSLVMRN